MNKSQIKTKNKKKDNPFTNDNYFSEDYQTNFSSFDYKSMGSAQSAQYLFLEDDPNPERPTDYSILHENIENLKSSNSPKRIVSSLKSIQKNYYSKQDDELLNIFEENDLFLHINNYILSENINVSIGALEFINEFTSENEDFVQLFSEHNLFNLLAQIINKYNPANFDEEEPNRYQCFFLAISIFAKVSRFSQIFIKRVWRILTPSLFFSIIENGNTDILMRCALIGKNTILKTMINQTNISFVKNVCESSIKGLLTLLNQQDFAIIEQSLFGIMKYFDESKKSIFQPILFRQTKIQTILENFYKSDKYTENIRANSLTITTHLINENIINDFHAESIFEFLMDNDHLKLKGNAFCCLYMAIFKDKLVDRPIFLDFLRQNFSEVLLECPFSNLYYGAKAIIYFLKNLDKNDFVSTLNDDMLKSMIKLLQFENSKIQYDTLILLYKYREFMESGIISSFKENGLNEVLNELIESDDDNLNYYAKVLFQYFNFEY